MQGRVDDKTGAGTPPVHRIKHRPHDGPISENWLESGSSQPPNFINVYPQLISGAECESIIDRFENDKRVMPSRGQYSENPVNRSGSMLPIGELADWQDIVQNLNAKIEDLVHHYARVYVAFQRVLLSGACSLSPLLLERIEPGQGFDWHFDGSLPEVESRVLAILLYLADIDEGGETQLAYQMAAIKPTAGSVAVFPPYWTHLHRGVTPQAGLKYNVTSYVVLDQ
jgi:hypothetical protein